MHKRGKLRGDLSNSCGDMAICRFLKTAAAAMMDFNFFKFNCQNAEKG